jgi:hypothetical protein
MKGPILNYIAAVVVVFLLGIHAWKPISAAEPAIPPLLASYRALPTAWDAAEITGGPTSGPDGNIYFMTGGYRGARFARFDPVSQRFEHLAELGSLATTTRYGRAFRVTAPVVFDRRGDAWLGTMALASSAGGRSGRLLSYSLDDMAFRDSLELAGRSIIGLGCDLSRDRLLLLTAGPRDTRLLGYDIAGRAWSDYGSTGVKSVRAPAMVTFDDGSAVIIDEGNSLYRFDPQAATLVKTSTTLPAGDGVLALAAAEDGNTVFGIMRESEVLFAYDARAEALRNLGRAFSGIEQPPNRQPEDAPKDMALFTGDGGRVFYTGYGSFQGIVASCDPQTGIHALVGALSSPVRVLAAPALGDASRGRDGRAYLAGHGSWGSGLYAFPPLPEAVPWSTTDRAYLCRHIPDDAVRIDGDLSDRNWQRIPPLNLVVNNGSAAPAKYRTVAYAAWSDTRLYFAYRCEIDAINTVGTQRDDDVWKGECAELFLCPRGADAPYYEIEINPHGVIYDSRVLSYSWTEHGLMYRTWAREWNPDMVCETKIQRDAEGRVTGWTLEASLPFSALDGVPRAGDVWLFNAFRIAHPADGRDEYQAWHPTFRDFHKTHQFPKLKFEK